MKITFVVPIANRRRGDVADLDDGSAGLLIAQQYATPADDNAVTALSTEDKMPARARRTRRPATEDPSRRVGDDPAPAGQDTGTS